MFMQQSAGSPVGPSPVPKPLVMTSVYAVLLVSMLFGPDAILGLGPPFNRWKHLTTVAVLLWGGLSVASVWFCTRYPHVRTALSHVIVCVLSIVLTFGIHVGLAFSGGPPMAPVYLAAGTVCIGPLLIPKQWRSIGLVISVALFAAIVLFWNPVFGQSPGVWW